MGRIRLEESLVIFGGYRVTFSAGEEPIYLQIAWPTKIDAKFIYLTRQMTLEDRRQELAGLCLIAIEQREYKGVTFESRLYGRPGAYTMGPIKNYDTGNT